MKLTLKKEPGAPKIDAGGVPRVNLLPRSIIEKREQGKLLKSWGARALAAVVVLVAACVGMFGWQTLTIMQLATTKAEGLRLVSEIDAKGEIQQLLSTESELRSYGAETMATDLGWKSTFARMVATFPEGSRLCSFDLVVGGVPEGAPEDGIGLVGTIEVCSSFQTMVPLLRSLAAVEGVRVVTVRNGSFDSTNNEYKHTLFVEIDQSIYETSKEGTGQPAESESVESDTEQATGDTVASTGDAGQIAGEFNDSGDPADGPVAEEEVA